MRPLSSSGGEVACFDGPFSFSLWSCLFGGSTPLLVAAPRLLTIGGGESGRAGDQAPVGRRSVEGPPRKVDLKHSGVQDCRVSEGLAFRARCPIPAKPSFFASGEVRSTAIEV